MGKEQDCKQLVLWEPSHVTQLCITEETGCLNFHAVRSTRRPPGHGPALAGAPHPVRTKSVHSPGSAPPHPDNSQSLPGMEGTQVWWGPSMVFIPGLSLMNLVLSHLSWLI